MRSALLMLSGLLLALAIVLGVRTSAEAMPTEKATSIRQPGNRLLRGRLLLVRRGGLRESGWSYGGDIGFRGRREGKPELPGSVLWANRIHRVRESHL